MKNKETFFNRVVKQGNSFCVRIPSKVYNKLNLEKGAVVGVELTNMKKEIKNMYSDAVKVYRKVIKGFSLEEVRDFLNYYAVEHTTGEKLKISKRYNQFKKLVENKKNIATIKKELKKTSCRKDIKK